MKLLVILFFITLYARINIFNQCKSYKNLNVKSSLKLNRLKNCTGRLKVFFINLAKLYKCFF